MQLLLIHADYLKFEVKQPTPAAEEIRPEQRSGEIKDVLVVFSAAEEADEAHVEQVAKKAAEEVFNIAQKVEAQRVAIYPYAHLSSSLASPKLAIRLLDATAEQLRSRGLEVHRLPFGWYKAFTLSCKGHPLSELSRTITAEVQEVAEAAAEEAKSKWLVLTPEGKEYPLNLSEIEACPPLTNSPLLKQYLVSEELGQKPGGEPAHIKLMRRLELVDYEPASDTGHFRFYPNGALVKGLLEDFAAQIAAEIGAVRIETPVLYRADEPDIAEQAAKFLQKDYKIKLPNRTLILRFSGDFGLFRMMKTTLMTYKQMPVRIFELSPSYRLEQSGETVGLKRLRAFTMPDIHCFCLDLKQGLEEYERLFEIYVKMVRSIGIEYAVIFRVVEDFYHQNRKFIARLLRLVSQPALIELLAERKHYWVLKHEFQMIDSVGGNAQLSTIQLDLEDSERYGIRYVDEKGEKRGCVILHSSIGSIERWIYAILEEAAKDQMAGKAPCLPLWLSPTQVRLVPLASRHLDFCQKIAGELEKLQIRADIDDRDESVSKKVRDAEREWVPYVIVIGDKELEAEKIPVRARGQKELKWLAVAELAAEIKQLTKGMPFRPLATNRLLSLRPIFFGG
ncbi:MAG: threonine--tRNA ligase [Candidatus Hadarchaeum sp.]|uniref:threonine--tRNA ligase n=1 Tax=Candidatus Hadarchaeum sp. TaxID=2883567 RepID=UPI003D0ADA26